MNCSHIKAVDKIVYKSIILQEFAGPDLDLLLFLALIFIAALLHTFSGGL